MVGIYKITNLITGDFYIGQSTDIEKRWCDHFCKGYGAIHSGPFQDAIDKYGKDGFEFSVLEECDKEDLIQREKYWIKKLSPTYNTVYDGHEVSAQTRKKISDKLKDRVQPRDIVEKRRQSAIERYKRIPRTNERHKKRIMVEEDDRNLTVLESVKAAAEYLGVKACTVSKALKRNNKVKGKKVWYVV